MTPRTNKTILFIAWTLACITIAYLIVFGLGCAPTLKYQRGCVIRAEVGGKVANSLGYVTRYVRGPDKLRPGRWHRQVEYKPDWYSDKWTPLNVTVIVVEGVRDYWFTPKEYSYNGTNWNKWEDK